jgi:hypothetical protein
MPQLTPLDWATFVDGSAIVPFYAACAGGLWVLAAIAPMCLRKFAAQRSFGGFNRK